MAADGAHSSTRKQLGIDLISENDTLQHPINVHFFGIKLSELLYSRIPAMLYFVYSSTAVAVLVAHALTRGEFVAQIPFFAPIFYGYYTTGWAHRLAAHTAIDFGPFTLPALIRLQKSR